MSEEKVDTKAADAQTAEPKKAKKSALSITERAAKEVMRVIEENQASYLKRNLVSSTSKVPQFDDEVSECLATLRRKHGYDVN